MGTIGKYRLHIAANRLLYQTMGSVEYRIGTLESRHLFLPSYKQSRIEYLSEQAISGVLLPLQYGTLYLNVAITMVDEKQGRQVSSPSPFKVYS